MEETRIAVLIMIVCFIWFGAGFLLGGLAEKIRQVKAERARLEAERSRLQSQTARQGE